MLPALVEQDLPAFGGALYEFNHRVGEMFAPLQGGIYGHRQTSAVVEFLRGRGIQGVGQSSWGPAAFAVLELDRADAVVLELRDRFGFSALEAFAARPRNRGAAIEPVE
jgi:predicted sugar kinase